MNNLKVLIVEDEVLIAETIRMYLEELNYIVTAICISYDEAIEAFHLNTPDLVLLDIRLFGAKSGIDVAHYLNSLDNKPPYVFLTSQIDKRILDAAIQTLPYGYITKPFLKETLWASIETAYHMYKSHIGEDDSIIINDGKKNHILSLDKILMLQADHVYTRFIMNDHIEYLCRNPLNHFQNKLPNTEFVKCHRSYVVNLRYIKNWNSFELTMNNGTKVPISKSHRDLVYQMLNK